MNKENQEAPRARTPEEIEERPHRPCVGSGFCCKSSACPFGEWDAHKHQCAYLESAYQGDSIEIYRCGRYEFIRQQPFANISPAFGTGCCMPMFNEARQHIIRVIAQGDNPQALHALNLDAL